MGGGTAVRVFLNGCEPNQTKGRKDVERTVTFGEIIVGVWVVFGFVELDGDFGCEVLGLGHVLACTGVGIRHLGETAWRGF